MDTSENHNNNNLDTLKLLGVIILLFLGPEKMIYYVRPESAETNMSNNRGSGLSKRAFASAAGYHF